ncbi:MAG: hypothetical protein ACKPKO_55875, partial [Candidatus Fonsibacter sp.]
MVLGCVLHHLETTCAQQKDRNAKGREKNGERTYEQQRSMFPEQCIISLLNNLLCLNILTETVGKKHRKKTHEQHRNMFPRG